MNILILVDFVLLLIISRIIYDDIKVFENSSPRCILETSFAKEVDFSQATEVSKELNHRKEKRKRPNKRRDRLPLKQKKLFRHQGYKNTKSKDPRFSNQRKLRRMYRGV